MAEPLIEQGLQTLLVTPEHPDAQHLFDMLQSEYVGMYGEPDPNPEGDLDRAHSTGGVVALLYLENRPVAVGGWTDEGQGVACLRRMYVRYDCRRRGLSRELLEVLERTAKAAGMRRMVLETGETMKAANVLYTSSGYVPTEPFGYYGEEPYVDSVFLGKDL